MEILESIKLSKIMIDISYIIILMAMPTCLIYMFSASISRKPTTKKQKIIISISLVMSITAFLINTIFSMNLNENMQKLQEKQYQTHRAYESFNQNKDKHKLILNTNSKIYN